MKSQAFFGEFVWLVNTIRNARRITFSDINQRWVRSSFSDGQPMSRSTFNRHKDAVLDIFGIKIACDSSDNYKYFIENEEVLKSDTIQNWMYSTLSVNTFLADNRSLHDRILLEPIQLDDNMMQAFLTAMKTNVSIKVKYHKFGEEQPTERLVDPYCVKLFNRRWYVLGRQRGIDQLRTFAFDRIKEYDVTALHFDLPKDFDARTYYIGSYGIFNSENQPVERIVIRVYGLTVKFFEQLPLHSSQKVISKGDDFVDFEYHVRCSIDLVNFVLSQGSSVQILSPKHLADKIQQKVTETLARYK